MNEERFWLLVSLQLAGEATAGELEELNRYLQLHPEKGLQAEIMRNLWKKEQQSAGDKAKSFDRHLQRLSSHLSEPAMQFEAVPAEEVDRVRGQVHEAADGDFNTLLEIGFATSIRREWDWRVSRGESLRGRRQARRCDAASFLPAR